MEQKKGLTGKVPGYFALFTLSEIVVVRVRLPLVPVMVSG
jgi:hypothetical protein